MASGAKEGAEEGKKRFKFNYEEDMELLRLVLKYEPYNAVHGSVAEKWEHIRTALCAYVDKQFSARACKDRYGILMQSGFRFKDPPSAQMIEDSSRVLTAIRHRVDEVKFKGKGKVERAPSVDLLLQVDPMLETPVVAHVATPPTQASPLHGPTSAVAISSKDVSTFLRLLDGQLRMSAQQLDDAKEERKFKRQKLEFEQRRFDQEMAFRAQEAQRRDQRDAEDRAQRHDEFQLLMDIVRSTLPKP